MNRPIYIILSGLCSLAMICATFTANHYLVNVSALGLIYSIMQFNHIEIKELLEKKEDKQ